MFTIVCRSSSKSTTALPKVSLPIGAACKNVLYVHLPFAGALFGLPSHQTILQRQVTGKQLAWQSELTSVARRAHEGHLASFVVLTTKQGRSSQFVPHCHAPHIGGLALVLVPGPQFGSCPSNAVRPHHRRHRHLHPRRRHPRECVNIYAPLMVLMSGACSVLLRYATFSHIPRSGASMDCHLLASWRQWANLPWYALHYWVLPTAHSLAGRAVLTGKSVCRAFVHGTLPTAANSSLIWIQPL